MVPSRRLVPGAFACVLALSACADQERDVSADPAALERGTQMADKVAESITIEDQGTVSPVLGNMNAELARAGTNVRIAKAELIVDPKTWDGSSTIIFANDRARGIGAEWVAGDPRREGRVGVTYAFDLAGSQPVVRNAAGGLRLATFGEVEAELERAMSAWRDETCSDAPITRVAVPAGVDPDQLDNLFNGSPEVAGRTYAQVSDIVHAGWQPLSFFTAFAGDDGPNILGVAFTFVFVDEEDNPTDIDGDGNDDIGPTRPPSTSTGSSPTSPATPSASRTSASSSSRANHERRHPARGREVRPAGAHERRLRRGCRHHSRHRPRVVLPDLGKQELNG
jgi:hypothetical protein